MATIAPRKPCARPGCREWATHGSYCERHFIEWQKQQQENRKQFSRVADEGRPNSTDRGYDSKWKQARKFFLMKHPICVICGRPATEVDHIIPHKGDYKLFWNSKNWQPLCHICHSRKTYSEVRDQKKQEKDHKFLNDDMGIVIIK